MVRISNLESPTGSRGVGLGIIDGDRRVVRGGKVFSSTEATGAFADFKTPKVDRVGDGDIFMAFTLSLATDSALMLRSFSSKGTEDRSVVGVAA